MKQKEIIQVVKKFLKPILMMLWNGKKNKLFNG